MTDAEEEYRALLVKCREYLMDSVPYSIDRLPDYNTQPHKLIKQISNILMTNGVPEGQTPGKLVYFPCKSCRHDHQGRLGENVHINFDNGCTEKECHCGRITTDEMFR